MLTTHLFLKIRFMTFQRELSMKLFRQTLFMLILMMVPTMPQKEVITFLKELHNRKILQVVCNLFSSTAWFIFPIITFSLK